MFGRRKNSLAVPYDKNGKIHVIRSSICTGEKVAGFKDSASRKSVELMLIRNDKVFREFPRQYQVDEAEIKWEW